jgi:hypothetical protein
MLFVRRYLSEHQDIELGFFTEGVIEMGIETAFLLGVLVGQWIMFWALWRRVSILTRYLASQAMDFRPVSPPGEAIIDTALDEFRDEG